MEMPLRRRFLRVTVLVAALAATGCARLLPSQSPSSATARPDSALSVAAFDTVWRLIRDTHYDRALKGLDWNAIGAEIRPRVERARSVADVRTALTDLISRLGDSHYGIIPAEAIAGADSGHAGSHEYGDLGMEVRLVSGAMVVTHVDADGAAARAGIATGWIVERVDSLDIPAILRGVAHTAGNFERRLAGVYAALAVQRRFAGEEGSGVHLTVRDPSDRKMQLTVSREASTAQIVRLGNLPPIVAQLSTERFLDPDGCVGLIRFSSWMPVLAAPFERAVREFRGCRGIILDLRGNLGGVAAMVMGTSGWFMSREDTLGILRTRDTELRYVSIPQHASGDGRRVDPYAGALALLVDGHSASTSEMFAAGLQDAGRARVFGDTTAGQALPATLYRLPNQDVLMYAVADFVTKRGTRLDRRGVIPDEVVPVRRPDLIAGRDLALQSAIRWIRTDRARANTP
ncbi:MAG: S41 family peptidase [Gemmatimonadaceae bacterium]